MLDFVTKRKLYFLISGTIILIGILSLLLPGGLKLGIEFTSGTTLQLRFDKNIPAEKIRGALSDLGYRSIVQTLGGNRYFIRTKLIETEEQEALVDKLQDKLGTGITVEEAYSVSPIVAKEMGRSAGIAIAIASIGILLYIAWAFRRMPSPFRLGTCAVVALIHDVLFVLGSFSILGRLFNIQIDALFITAVLAVVGYSVNDTVVIFDRLRENLWRMGRKDLQRVINRSLTETLSRSLNTSLTTLFVLVALLLFGGVTIKFFILAITIGLIAGTYSSLFIAPQLWLTWEVKSV